MELIYIYKCINPKGTFSDFAKWYKNLSVLDRAVYKYNLEIIKGSK